MRKLVIVALLVGGTVYFYRRSKLPPERRDLALRRAMNERLAPVLMRQGAANGTRTGFGVVEHVGRKSGTVRWTMIHPVPLGDRLAVPVPYAEGGQWPRNVLAAGRCRLQYRDNIYSLSNPRIVGEAAVDGLPPAEKLICRVTGGRYLLMDVDSVVPGRFDDATEEHEQAGASSPA